MACVSMFYKRNIHKAMCMAVMFSFITIKFWSKIPEQSVNLARVSSLPPNSKIPFLAPLSWLWVSHYHRNDFLEVPPCFPMVALSKKIHVKMPLLGLANGPHLEMDFITAVDVSLRL